MSKFQGILGARRGDPEPAGKPTTPADQSTQGPAALPSPAPPIPLPKPRRGRPPGKRSDPGFVQVTAYVPADLHHEIKLALLKERQGREFSELVGDLLKGWLDSRP